VSSRLGRIGAFVVALLTLALVNAASVGATLPAGYAPGSTDNPAPAAAGEGFGAALVNAGDVNGDAVDDVLAGVPSAPFTGVPGVSGKVVFVDGRTGGVIESVPPPQTELISNQGAPSGFGTQVATVGDLNGDGVPEHAVSAPGSDASAGGVDMGLVYVLEGTTHDVIKRIQIAVDDRPGSSPGFGEGLASPAGQPACSGFAGTADCPEAPGSLVALGDLDGGGEPDLVVGAPDYEENAAADTNPTACPFGGPATCPGLGRVYVYSGEAVAGSVNAPLQDPIFIVHYFDRATAAQQPRLGTVLSPIGDVGSCAFDPTQAVFQTESCLDVTPEHAPSNVPDGYPDYLVGAPGLTGGHAFVVDGRHGLLIAKLSSPDPDTGSGFAASVARPAPGNLGASALPDIYLGATGQDIGGAADQGRGFLFTGDVVAPGLLMRLDDPAPSANAGFGTFAGLGDMAGADGLNEYALGRLGGGPLQIVSSCGPTVVLTIPDAAPGTGFGGALAPMGDLNGDGYLDLAVGAPGHDNGRGRVYLLRSTGGAGSDRSCAPPGGGGDPGGGGGGGDGGGAPIGAGTPGPATPKSPGQKKVASLARRTLTLKSSRRSFRLAQGVTLTGVLRASRNKRACQRKQKIAIQRYTAVSRSWPTVDVAVTKANGRFTVRLRPALAETLRYQALVKQTRRCGGAISKRIKVKVTG
jgi:FG-GAP repeat